MTTTVDRSTLADLERASELEWLETNGTGAFAMGTATGLPTRRYHGLLVASLRPPTERVVTLARLDETVRCDGVEIELATVRYPGVVQPRGHRHLAEFRLDPSPTWTWELPGGARLSKTLMLVPGEQTVVVRYRADRPLDLRVAPFLAGRDYHALGKARAEPPTMHLFSSGGPLVPDAAWYHATEYAAERERGLDFQEDLFRPGWFQLDGDGWIVASLAAAPWDGQRVDAVAVQRAARARRSDDASSRGRLERAADSYLVSRGDGSLTVIAGYPWFTDWGRDTMIALPGLYLARGRLDEARDVLRGFLAHLDRGLIPNLFPDRGARPEYNTVDATLWLFQAARAYLEAGGDRGFVLGEVYLAGKEIIRWHERGTHHGIRLDPGDGLLIGGGPGTQLTWMDARVDGRVVTPRHGKAVEINALWHGALALMAMWADEVREPAWAAHYREMAARAAGAFLPTFWNESRGCLYDVILPEGPDGRIRPNQLFALALSSELVPADKARSVLEVVARELLTPVGLRTLARGDEGYVPRYGGGPAERDGAYHQGTVWPWLLGPYVRAVLRVYGRTPEVRSRCRALLDGIERHLDEACLGHISEVFDAEPPHRPGGAPAQAWSASEILALLAVDLPVDAPLPAPR